MSLLKELLEDAAAGATSAIAVAGVREPIGAKKEDKKDKKKKKKEHPTLLRRLMKEEAEDPSFDVNDVISKLKTAEKAEEVTRDTVPFGLEDADGNIIKVHVRAEQAEDFESALASALDEMENSTTEIAEILFELREKFDIVDVEWGTIQEDEEEDFDLEGGEDELGGDEEGMGDELGDEESADDMVADDTADAKTALDKVIDMMASQADATKAEAEAKKAEADAEAAKYAAQAAEQKIKAEEEVLDMETHNKEQQEKEKEAKKLAALAKYRHDKAKEAENMMDAPVDDSTDIPEDTALPEDEEEDKDLTDKDEMSPEEYLDYVNVHLRSQN